VSIDELGRRFAGGPAGHFMLSELGADPAFVFCATELRFRTQWQFNTGRGVSGSELAGLAPISNYRTIARATAASAAFPFAFPAVRVPPEARPPGTYRGQDRDKLVAQLELTDGGVFDNMGLEPVWRDHEAQLASHSAIAFNSGMR
jgi:NTE family protein